MIYQILMTVAAIVFVIGVLWITLVRKKQPRPNIKFIDFISLGAFFFGVFALSNLLTSASNTKPELNDTITKLILVIYPIVLLFFGAVVVVLHYRKSGVNSTVGDDERTEIGNTKSARNALLATNIGLFAYLLSTETLTRNSLIVILFSGVIIYSVSLLFYYYWKG